VYGTRKQAKDAKHVILMVLRFLRVGWVLAWLARAILNIAITKGSAIATNRHSSKGKHTAQLSETRRQHKKQGPVTLYFL